MKKIINGKRYDTETATQVGYWENMADIRNFGYVCETLYRKRGGEHFLHGEGGASTKYAKSYGLNEWGFGERIMPMTHEEARQWAEEHLECDEYEAEFGEAPEDDERATVYATVSAEAKRKLERMALEQGKTQAEVLESIISAA